MTDSPTYMVIMATPNPANMEQVQEYTAQIGPVMMQGGGKMVGRYKTAEQVVGTDGPAMVAIAEFESAQAIHDLVASEPYKALADLRAAAFSKLNMMISGGM